MNEILVTWGGTGSGMTAKFTQDTILKTTLEGVEAASVTVLKGSWGGGASITIDHPYFIAILVPLAGAFLPTYMGYVGDPTLEE